MADYFRLRQICLVANDLPRVISDSDNGAADEADDTGRAQMVQAQRVMPMRQAQLRKLTPRGRGGNGLECRLAAPAELVVAALVDERRLKEFCQKYATVKQFISTWLDYFERSTTLSRAW